MAEEELDPLVGVEVARRRASARDPFDGERRRDGAQAVAETPRDEASVVVDQLRRDERLGTPFETITPASTTGMGSKAVRGRRRVRLVS